MYALNLHIHMYKCIYIYPLNYNINLEFSNILESRSSKPHDINLTSTKKLLARRLGRMHLSYKKNKARGVANTTSKTLKTRQTAQQSSASHDHKKQSSHTPCTASSASRAHRKQSHRTFCNNTSPSRAHRNQPCVCLSSSLSWLEP